MQSEESNALVKLAKAVIEHAPEGGDAFWGIKFSDIEAALSAAEPQPAPSVAVKAIEAVWKCSFVIESSVRRGDGPDQYAGVTEALRLVKEARSALSAQVQDVAGWRTMDSAPKDGTPVILWTVWVGDEISPDPFSEVQIGYWDHGNDLPESHDFSRRPEWVVQRIGEPTHWMPLPAAPAKQEG